MARLRKAAGIMPLIVAIAAVILDGRTAVAGIREGLTLCYMTVIPALFPFMILSGVLLNRILGTKLGVLRKFSNACGIPEGAESIFVTGFLSGYPIGAQITAQACYDKRISASAARRMLGFCSNAGPAFIFGMLSPVFSNPVAPWALYGILILSAWLVGIVLPERTKENCVVFVKNPANMSDVLHRTIRNLALVCGWILVFRVIVGYCSKWFLWRRITERNVLLFWGFV